MAAKTIQVVLYACLLGTFLASGGKHGERNGRCLQQTEMSAGSLSRAPCHPNPCKERWIVEENSKTKTTGACENHWSCCSEDDQCVLSVIHCTLEISTANLEQPLCEDHGISVMPNDNCDITVDVSNFNSSNITSVTLVIKYTYNCTTRHYCHSTCQHYYRTREQKRRASRSSEPEDRCHNDISHKDRASRYCSADDMNTFKQTTTLEVLFPTPRLTLSECYNCTCSELDNNTLTTSMNCNVTMTCSLSLDSEVVKDIWVYFRFRNANAVRTVTAQCEPKKQDRSANYNWEVYRDDNFDCNLEIPQFGSDDVGEYECGIVDVSYTNTVNNVARSETRNLLVVDDETPINEESQGSNLRQIIGSTVGGAVGLLLMITLVMGLLKIWRAKAKNQYGHIQEQNGGEVQERNQLLDPERPRGYGAVVGNRPVEAEPPGGQEHQEHQEQENEHEGGNSSTSSTLTSTESQPREEDSLQFLMERGSINSKEASTDGGNAHAPLQQTAAKGSPEDDLAEDLSPSIHEQVSFVRKLTQSPGKTPQDNEAPEDKNLTCPECGRVYKIGQIQFYRKHYMKC